MSFLTMDRARSGCRVAACLNQKHRTTRVTMKSDIAKVTMMTAMASFCPVTAGGAACAFTSTSTVVQVSWSAQERTPSGHAWSSPCVRALDMVLYLLLGLPWTVLPRGCLPRGRRC